MQTKENLLVSCGTGFKTLQYKEQKKIQKKIRKKKKKNEERNILTEYSAPISASKTPKSKTKTQNIFYQNPKYFSFKTPKIQNKTPIFFS